MGATGIFRDVAANVAGFLAGRIGSEVEAVRLGRKSEIEIDDAGLDDRALIFGVERENAVHACENDHHAAGAGERAAGKARTGAAANDGNVVLGGELGDL